MQLHINGIDCITKIKIWEKIDKRATFLLNIQIEIKEKSNVIHFCEALNVFEIL